MTDEPEVGQRAEDEVRRLLAAARHDEPVPADVVARIDAALAAESPPGGSGTPDVDRVVDLDARRRRRRRTGLLAAAVVVVAGVGVGAVGIGTDGLPVGGPDGAEVADGAGSADGSAGSDGGSSGPGAPDAEGQEERGPSVMGARAPLPRVRTGPTLAADVTRALRTAGVLSAARARCAPAAEGQEVVRVLADGSRAELLVSGATGGRRTVALHPCGPGEEVGETPLATLVVPAD
ncbi:hypothetical protein [Nocardioides sp. CFH 31398]|uniref:hypothetical protein n=1 Tax=Nocardioides sp. CFH 31398 TaxID=2919579 RepID=UPI001F051A15|nr:hypothetical protein [Nocardioides sp. CFH 31398]MCH1865708.1 hypothetical protein [Nocardioides sp. CFH 31398]